MFDEKIIKEEVERRFNDQIEDVVKEGLSKTKFVVEDVIKDIVKDKVKSDLWKLDEKYIHRKISDQAKMLVNEMMEHKVKSYVEMHLKDIIIIKLNNDMQKTVFSVLENMVKNCVVVDERKIEEQFSHMQDEIQAAYGSGRDERSF